MLCFADGSQQLGAGHQVRIRALGKALADRGHEVRFACRSLPGSTHEWTWSGLDVAVSEEADATVALTAALTEWPADICCLDHYDCGLPRGVLTVRFHDAGQGAAPAADMVVDAVGNASDVPAAIPCVGLPYAVIRSDFSRVRHRGGSGFLVVLGGTDATGTLPRLLSAMRDRGVDCRVAGVDDPAARGWGATEGLGRLSAPKLAEALADADAVICTASTVALEAASVGTPAVLVHLARNQDGVARKARRAGVPVLSAADVESALDRVPAVWRGCDGRGASRVAARIDEARWCRQQGLIRPARFGDAEWLMALQQDPAVRSASLRDDEVRWGTHAAWLSETLADPGRRLFIGHDSGRDVGFVRLDRADQDVAVVSIAVAPWARGQGYAQRLLEALAAFAEVQDFCRVLEAVVRCDNRASMALFEKAGYQAVRHASTNGRDVRVLHKELRND